MKKSTPRPLNQLSLFDIFTENLGKTDIEVLPKAEETIDNLKNIENDSHDNIGRNEGDAGQQRRSDLQDGSRKLQGEATLFTAEGPTTGTVRKDEKSGDTDRLPERNDMAVLHDGQRTDGRWDDGIPSGGNGLAGLGATGRSVNYHNTSPLGWSSSFNKARHLKDNIAALETLHLLDNELRPATKEEQDILAKYSGWGGLKEILLDPANDAQ